MTGTLLHTNELFRDDLFQLDTNVVEADNAHDKANKLIGWYWSEMPLKCPSERVVALALGEDWMIVRSFWKEIDYSCELHQRYHPAYNPPTLEDHLKELSHGC